jgi:hypothetical protein
MDKAAERELMNEIGASVLLEDAGLADVVKTTDRADAASHSGGDGGYTVLSRTFGGTPEAKLALAFLAGIASEIAVGYPDGVDKGIADLSRVDNRTVKTFQAALPYLDASRGEDYKGYNGIEHFVVSPEQEAREKEIIAKLKAFNAAEKANALKSAERELKYGNGTLSQEDLDTVNALRLTPEELKEARAMEVEAHRQAKVKALQCKDPYYLDLLDTMHIILTSGKKEMHNSSEGVEERAADAFVVKLRTNAKLLARSLSPDAAAYIEANTCESEMDDTPQRRSTGPRQKGKL